MTAALPTMRPRLISAAEVQGRVLKSWSTKWCIVAEDAMYYFEREYDMDRFVAIAPCKLAAIPELLLSTAAARLSLRPSVARKVGAYDGHDFTLCVTEADGSENFLSVESVVHMDHWMPALTSAAGGAAVANKRGSVADLAYRNELEFEKAGHLIKKGGSVKVRRKVNAIVSVKNVGFSFVVLYSRTRITRDLTICDSFIHLFRARRSSAVSFCCARRLSCISRARMRRSTARWARLC